MWWRLSRSTWTKQKGAGNRWAFRKIVKTGDPPGILVYAGGRPVGWCAVGPRESYPALERSRTLKRVDDEPVWSVTCFFVDRPYRRKGLTGKLLEAAVAYARSRGAKIVEGYPVAPRQGSLPDAFAWTGLVGAFEKAGFVEVARRSPSRPIVRVGAGKSQIV
jgi:GNAT superfamily N-acetyltransferase